MLINYLSIIWLIVFLAGCTPNTPQPKSKDDNSPQRIEVRAAIDIGSGSTKLKVAEIDVKTNKIVKILFKKDVPISFEKELSNSQDLKFSKQVIDHAVQVFADLKDEAEKYHAKKVIGIATASFRKAKNAQELIFKIEERTGIGIFIIDQKQEGAIAFQGAIATCISACNENAVTWDIGGGSFQFTSEDPNKKLLVYEGTLASVPFQNYIIEELQKKTLSPSATPNPMSDDDMRKALDYANETSKQVTPYIQNKIKENGTIVLGVGGVFAGQIQNMFNKNEDEELLVTRDLLQQKLELYKGLDNKGLAAAIKKDVADTATASGLTGHLNTFFSNIVLILGFMDGLHINGVYVVDINNADGAMTTPKYWEEDKFDIRELESAAMPQTLFLNLFA